LSTPGNPYDPSEPQGGMPSGYPPPGRYAPYPAQQGGYAPTGTRGYLQGGPVGFGDAIKQAIQNTFNYQGRASRSAYWWFALFSIIVLIVMGFLGAALKSFGLVIDFIIYIGLFLTSLSLTVRRLHDTDRSGWWYLIAFVPFVGGIVLLVFTLLKGTPGPNRFG
jgi:uncharacterized membrane protein YhaH (DUF805 family)